MAALPKSVLEAALNQVDRAHDDELVQDITGQTARLQEQQATAPTPQWSLPSLDSLLGNSAPAQQQQVAPVPAAMPTMQAPQQRQQPTQGWTLPSLNSLLGLPDEQPQQQKPKPGFDMGSVTLEDGRQQQSPSLRPGEQMGDVQITQGGGRTGDPNGGVEQWADYVDEASKAYGVPPAIIKGIMHIESSGNPGAVSSQGAMGLMQVMPFHYQPGEDGMDPRTSVLRGAKILADNYRRWGDWDRAAAAYFGAIDDQGNITGATDATGTNGTNYVRLFRDAAGLYGGVPDARQSLNAAPASPPAQGAAAPDAAGVPPAPAASPPSPWANEQATGGLMMKAEDEQLGPKPRPDRNIEPLGPARVGAPMDQRYYESGLGTNRNIPVWGGFIQEGTEPPAPWRNVPVQGAYPDEQYVDENGAYTVPMMQKSDGTEDFLPGDGGVAPQTYEQPFNPDDGPREATPGSVGAQPLPQPAYADPTVSDPAYTQDPTAAPVVDPLDPSTFGPSALPASSAGPRFMQPQPAYRDPREGQGIIARGIDAIGQYLPSTPIVETKPGDAKMFMGEQPASIGTPWDKNDGLWQWRGRLAEGTADALARGLGQDPDQLLLNVTVGGVPIQMSVSELLENVTDPLLGAGFGVGDMVLDAAGKAVMRLVAPYAKGAARETIGRLLNAEPVQNAARAGMEAVREGADALGRGLQGVGREVAGGLRSVAEEAAYQATFGPRSMARNIVPPGVADRMTGVSVRVVDDPAIVRAIEAAGGSVDRNRGVSVPLVRAQEAEAAGRPVFRGVVYYEPAPPGATKSSYLGELGSGGDQFGGNQTIGAAPSRFRNPIITTHGGDPHADLARQIGIDLDAVYAQLQQPALDAVSGRGDKALLDAVARLGGDATALTDGLSRYADDADMLLQAATENVIWTRARKSGHDGLMIFEPYRDGSERLALTEVGDFREAANPTPARRGGYTLRDEYPLASRAPRLPNDPITAPALNDTPPPLPSDVATRIDAVLGELNEYGMPTGELNWAMQSWHVYPEGSAMREKALALLERATGSSDPAEASALVKSRLAEREAKNPVMLGPSTGPRNAALGTQLATDAGNALAGSMVGAVAPADTPEERLRNTALGAAGFPIAGRLMRRAGGALGTPGIGPNGRPSKPTVEVLQQELDGMRALIQRARAEGNTDLERRAIDRAWQLESALVDAKNARLALEPRITSDVGRRVEGPVTQLAAEDRLAVGRERVSPDAASELTQPSAVATDMSGRMNSALPGFDPASAAMGGAAGAMSEGEDGEQGDPLRTAAGVFIAGLGNSRYGRRFVANAARRAQQGPPPNLWEVLQGTRFSWGMLGNFSTGLVNAAGAPVEVAMGLPAEALRMGVMRGRPLPVVNEAIELAGGLRDGARQLLATALGEIPPSVRNAPDFRPPLAERMTGTMGRAGNVDIGAVVGEAIDLPGRITSQAPDAFWRPVLLQWGRAREAANIVAENGVSKLDPAAQWRELQRLKNNPTLAESQRMTDAAQKWADEMGYKGDEGYWEGVAKGIFRPRGRITTSADPVAQQVHEALGSFVMPFLGSVWKLHKLAATRVPGAGFVANRSLPLDEKLSRQLIGGATIYMLADYAAQGMITGPGPSDPDEAAIVNQRMPKNSTYVPGAGWVSNDTFGSAGPYLNAIGGYYDSRRYQTDKEKATPGKGDESALKYVLRGFERFPVAQAAQSVIAMVESPIKGTSDMLANAASSFAPAPYRSYQASQDPYARTVDREAGMDQGGAGALAEQTRQRVISRVGYVPGLGAREDLQPALDRFGRPVENERQGAAAFLPRVSNPKPDQLAEVFTRAGIEPGMPPSEIDNIPLTTEQKREWLRVRGEWLASKQDILERNADAPEARRKSVFGAQMENGADRAAQAVRRMFTQQQREAAKQRRAS